LVTARRRELGDLTRDHLRRLGFPETDIIYCEGNCKAAAIRRRFENLEEYSHVVFVDDLEFNVLGVANEHPRFSCYLYDRSFD
jgi:hypothetical protein